VDDVSRVIDAGVLIPGPSLSDLDGPGDSSADAAFDRLIGEVFDDGPVEAAVVTPEHRVDPASVRDPYRAADFARATNDFVLDRRLRRDERLWGSIVVATQLPERAAEEIRRLGGEPRFRQVMLDGNAIGRTFGHAVFRPIFDAAAECELPVVIRAPEPSTTLAPYAAGGAVGLPLEQRTLVAQGLMTHLVSLIANGLFDRHSALRVVLWGGGISWVAPMMWRFEIDFKGVRREVPWVSRLPTEYLETNIRLVTHPLEQAPRGALASLTALAGGADLLVYGSGHGRSDADSVTRVREALPLEWHDRVFHRNAVDLYG
jgi:uncharacterized protein